MKLKTTLIAMAMTAAAVVGLAAFVCNEDSTTLESVAPHPSIPEGYDSQDACKKQETLWKNVQETAYKQPPFPEFPKLGLKELKKMKEQGVAVKGRHQSDFAPAGWKKYLHARGAVAKVKLVPKGGSYTGIFQGAECALLRLSLTYKPEKAVAPGLAFKVLRSGSPSANVSALVTLTGQGDDFNFFANPMSNIVPKEKGVGPWLVHKIFSSATHYPEELVLKHMASVDAQGATVKDAMAPRQLFFVPNDKLKFRSDAHDVREDFITIPPGTVVYQVRALSDKHRDFNYDQEYTHKHAETFLAESEHIADIVTTSEFIASQFGDDGIFFRHEIRP